MISGSMYKTPKAPTAPHKVRCSSLNQLLIATVTEYELVYGTGIALSTSYFYLLEI